MTFLGGTFLRWVLALLFAGILLRLILFAVSFGRGGKEPEESPSGSGFLRTLVPCHGAFAKSPVRVGLGYVFHLCLILVPIGFSGHLALWSDALFAWALPDALVDAMSGLVVLIIIFFLVRRIFLERFRQGSTPSDFALLVLTGLPFFSGAMLTHVSQSFWAFHILSGAAFLIMVVFLFVRPRLKESRCTACGSCAVECPGRALRSWDEGERRVLEYTPSRCIACGTCVAVCPEGAATLRHSLGLRNFFRRFSGERIHAAAMESCEGCGERFAPRPQVGKLGRETDQENVRYCEGCKRERVAREMLLPGTHA